MRTNSGTSGPCIRHLLLLSLLPFPLVTPRLQTMSRIIYDEFANITDEQKAIMTYRETLEQAARGC